jgi:hypothetical protein
MARSIERLTDFAKDVAWRAAVFHSGMGFRMLYLQGQGHEIQVRIGPRGSVQKAICKHPDGFEHPIVGGQKNIAGHMYDVSRGFWF